MASVHISKKTALLKRKRWSWRPQQCLSSVRRTTALREEALDPVFPASEDWIALVPQENPVFTKDLLRMFLRDLPVPLELLLSIGKYVTKLCKLHLMLIGAIYYEYNQVFSLVKYRILYYVFLDDATTCYFEAIFIYH